MRRANPNKTITSLAMPEAGLPVLVPCTRKKRDGFVFLGDEPPSVRVLPRKALEIFIDRNTREEFEKEYGAVPEHTRRMSVYVLCLAEAISERSDESLYRLVKRSAELLDPNVHFRLLWEKIRRGPLNELGTTLNSGIYQSRFVVWWAERQRRFAAGLYCKDMATALRALVLSRIGEPGGLGVCQRCGTPFPRSRRKQAYCSYKCQAAAGMARYRARKKRKARKRR